MLFCILALLTFGACSKPKGESVHGENIWDNTLESGASGGGHDISAELTYTHSMQTDFASEFTVDYYEEGYKLITLSDGSRFLIVPEAEEAPKPGKEQEKAENAEKNMPRESPENTAAVPEDLPKDIVIVRQPLTNIYLAASAVMDMFCAMDALDCVTLSGIEQEAWHIEKARAAMVEGKIIYAGKYSAPDYELIKASGCTLSVQSTMLEHVPEVKEQLELLGIHVFEDHSSYEEHPLGRMEWIKVYGVLTGHEMEAQAAYDVQKDAFEKGTSTEKLGKKVAFFNVTSTGAINIRKPQDYIAKMIGMAGGTYAFEDIEVPEGATGTMNIQMELFFAGAQDADVLIYNSTIAGEIHSMEDLLALSPLFADFKAVQEGNVWCMSADFFQNSMELGTAVEDIHRMLLTVGGADDGEGTEMGEEIEEKVKEEMKEEMKQITDEETGGEIKEAFTFLYKLK